MSDIFRKFRFTIVSVILLALIGSYYLVFEKNKQADEDERKPLFENLKKDDLTYVELVYPDSTVVTSIDSGQWYVLKADKKYRADKYSMDSILDNIAELKVKSVISETGANMAEYGLDKPVVTVIAKSKSGEYSFKLGNESPVGTGEYASTQEGRVVIVDSSQVWPFKDRNVNDLRDKEIVNLDEDRISVVKFKSADFDLTLIKSDGLWTNKSIPEYVKLNHLNIEGLVRSFSDLRVMNYVDGESKKLSDYGLDKPSYTLTLVEGGKDIDYYFGNVSSENNYYGKIENNESVFVISSYNFDQLPQDINDLRIKKIFDMDKDIITNLIISKGEDIYSINKTEGKWFLTKNDGKKKEFNIDDLLSEIINLEIIEFVDDEPKDLADYSLANPATKIELTDNNEKKQTLFLGNTKDADRIFAKQGELASVYMINNTVNNLITEMTDKTVIETDASVVGSK